MRALKINMMMTAIKKIPGSLLLLSVSLLFLHQGCSYRAWYEGFKERERQECYKHLNHGDIASCLERVESMSYDEYKRSTDN
jgi:hypothetical protein